MGSHTCKLHTILYCNFERTVALSESPRVMVAGGAATAREEWMTRTAVLARAAPQTALPLLSSLVAHRQQHIMHSIQGLPCLPVDCFGLAVTGMNLVLCL